MVDNEEVRNQVQDMEISEFDPLDFGFEISRVFINNTYFLQVLVDDDFKKSYTIYGTELPLHSIVYNCDVISGLIVLVLA